MEHLEGETMLIKIWIGACVGLSVTVLLIILSGLGVI